MLDIIKARRLAIGCEVVNLETCYPSKAIKFAAKTGHHVIVQEKEAFTCFTVWLDEDEDELLENHTITTLDELYKLLTKHAK